MTRATVGWEYSIAGFLVRTLNSQSLDDVVKNLLERTECNIVLAAPLGLGKPHRLLNAIYQAVEKNKDSSLAIYTALSLTPPTAGSDLEKRFLNPFLDRHFGADFPSLHYAKAQRRSALPANISVQEFYMQSGGLLNSSQAQQNYNSLNYTHVARAVAGKNINALVQKVAREPNGRRLSMSCNPDLTFDLLDEIKYLGKPRPMLIAEVDPQLPWIGGTAAVDEDYFDIVLDLPAPAPKLFALPRQAVTDPEYAIGLRASALIKDGGTLQIGIGSLSDALCHALILRHRNNAEYRTILNQLAPGYLDSELVKNHGGAEPFSLGLYGASEMVNDGFMHLYQAGILKRRVVDDIGVMQREHDDTLTDADKQKLLAEGHWLDGGFYLGSHDLYQWLRDMPIDEKNGIGMTRISHINELYGGNESLERLQRRDARFCNTCMMTTVLGAAVSDALEDGRVVSGVGGQYNFVAMAHALRDGRSILLFRGIREQAGTAHSNVLWNYGHTTIPRHLRDIAVNEYGVADLRGANDEDCIKAMLAICDARFSAKLIDKAKRELKLDVRFEAPISWTLNRPEQISMALKPFRERNLLPDYPIGCDFTGVELRVIKALGFLKAGTASAFGKARLIAAAMLSSPAQDKDAMERMNLEAPNTLNEKLTARLVSYALNKTKS
ncbi:MAG: acetyl-CoA hydrolase/transferase C-terminal domain-containing protein [Arenimonas sp.]